MVLAAGVNSAEQTSAEMNLPGHTEGSLNSFTQLQPSSEKKEEE